MRTRKMLFVLFALFVIAGCGGGGTKGCNSCPTTPTTCTTTFTANPTVFEYTGGTGNATAATSAGCTLCSELATSDSSWLVISGQSGGIIDYTVLPGTSNVDETGRLTKCGKVITITRRAKPTQNCSYSASRTFVVFDPGAQSTTINITASSANCPTCIEVPSNLPSWLTVTNNNGTLSIFVTANSDFRSHTFTVCGVTITVNHNPPASCNYVVSPTRITFPWEGGQQTVVITSPNECTCTNISAPGLTWQLNGNQLVLTAGTNGYSARSGIVVFCSAVVDWTQNPRPENPPQQTCQDYDATNYGQPGSCSYAAPTVTLTANPTTVVQNGFSSLIYSYSNAEYGCTMSGDWSGTKSASHNTISGSQSTGSLTSVRTYNYGLTCKGKGGERTASATITVTAAQTCTYLVGNNQTTWNIPRGGSSFGISVETTPDTCVWTAVSHNLFVRIMSSATNTGDGEVSVRFDPNNTGGVLTGTATIAGRTLTFIQSN